VDDFRKAVKAELSNKLASVHSSELLVYLNRASFEKTRDLRYKEEPLEEDSLVDRLGGSKKDALIVVVPTNTGIILKKLNVKTLLSPLDVSLPKLGAEEPEFIARAIESDGVNHDWREFAVDLILSWLGKDDAIGERIPPMAFARCTRGGKTRALKEIAMMLKTRRPDVSVIYVSFNDSTSVEEWEQDDPVQTLCRRIAYQAKPPTADSLSFSEFRYSLEVKDWLGNTPCVLLVDELNLLNCLPGENDEEKRKGSNFAAFIKQTFLANQGRYFVFSSRINPKSLALTVYMEKMGNRGLVFQQLPVIDDLTVCKELLHLEPTWNARKALYYGLSPALMHTKAVNLEFKDMLATLSKSNHLNFKQLKDLLETFVTGEYIKVPTLLLPFMDVDSKGKVKWIPVYMVAVLEIYAKALSSEPISNILSGICSLFNSFVEAKERSGDAWEALFVITLLIRILTKKYLHPLIPRSTSATVDNVSYETLGCSECSNVTDLISMIKTPDSYPHITIYYPQIAEFQKYDVIVVIFNSPQDRKIFGYQLKEGKRIPQVQAEPSLTSSFVVRGQAANHQSDKRGWTVVSKSDIEDFFAVSGSDWTPDAWKKLLKTERNIVDPKKKRSRTRTKSTSSQPIAQRSSSRIKKRTHEQL
jgi:hypothetical protein